MGSAWFPGTIARQIPNGTEKINSDNHMRSKTLRFGQDNNFQLFLFFESPFFLWSLGVRLPGVRLREK
jgi:hypothetical protein